MNYFNKLFKNISKPLLLLPVAFAFISILMMLTTSYDNGIVISRTVIVQTIAYILGFIAVFVIIHMDYSIFEEMKKPLYIGSVLFLLTPMIPGLGVEQFGAKSWIDLGFTTFQPSEIVKITFVLLVASYFNKHSGELRNLKGFAKAVAYAAPIILIVLKEDFGSAAVFVGMWISMVLFAGVNKKLFAKVCGVGVILMPIAYKFLDPYQQLRITAFLYPNDLSINANYQVWHSKVAIGSGGFFGKGLFQGTQKNLDFLPVMNSDFVFAVLCEEFGFLGGAILIGLYAWFIFSTTKLAFDSKDFYGGLVVIGFVGMFLFQILENIAMCMGLMPVTGITLPFISYGGSSVIANMIAVGFILNIAISNRGIAFIKE
ncbi:MAG: FtsW/RodA/SpoVE family cell cycle protein [Anaerovoracaceae bacterium]